MPRLTARLWRRVVFRTLSHLILVVTASVTLCYLLLTALSSGLGSAGLVAAIVGPLVLGGPMIFYMSLKNEQLRLAYRELEESATRDSLTGCLNHGAFAQRVEEWLARNAGLGYGALLVIDADHFKAINDRFGHDRGDMALRLIVGALRDSTMRGELVGRLGGEEFGVFLPHLDRGTARARAEAIRLAIADLEFRADDQPHRLTVSVGGSVFVGPASFSHLFREADRNLYDVKAAGRNGVAVFPSTRPVSTGRAQDREIFARAG